MTAERRPDRLLPALGAQERAPLKLHDYETDRDQDRQLKRTTPDRQAVELSRLIGLTNAANGALAPVIFIVRERAKQEELASTTSSGRASARWR